MYCLGPGAQTDLDEDVTEARDCFLRYFVRLQSQRRLLWEIGEKVRVVPRMCQTVLTGHSTDPSKEFRTAEICGRRQIFYLHHLTNGNQFRFAQMKEAPTTNSHPGNAPTVSAQDVDNMQQRLAKVGL